MTSWNRQLSHKILMIIATITIAQFIIVGRLAYLQITRTKDLQTKSKNNFLRYETTSSMRGNIIDSKGKLLATNRPVINIYWKGSGSKKLTTTQKELLSFLQTLTNIKLEESETTIAHAEKKAQKILLAKDIKFDQLSKVAEHFSNQSQISIETGFIRHYPYKALASHVLGYLGNIDIGWAGRMGLEKSYETILRGKSGVTQKVLNSFGKHLAEKEIEKSLTGQDITVTLDLSLQRIAEMLFPKDRRGAFILMDSSNGSLRVALSQPDFDPNLFLGKLENETWQKLKDKRPFLNRVFNATYPPGSIFKLVTLGAALETNIIQQDSEWECTGSVMVGKRKSHCHKRDGHGFITATEAVAKSCNTPFYEIAKYLDIDVLAQYARFFGLGKSTNSVFNDSSGLVPTREWKMLKKGERWWLGETLSTNIGQSYLLTTPIQIARMIASIHMGYLVSPRILEEAEVVYEPLNLSYKTRTFLQETMYEVAQTGTAKSLKKLDDFTIYAKTSTAQTSTLKKRKMGESFLEHGWVTANFQYKNNPPHTLVVLVENAGNARLSLIIAKAFMKSYRDLINLRERRQKKQSI